MMEPSRESPIALETRVRALVALRPPLSGTAYRLALLSLRAPAEPWWAPQKVTEP